MASSRAGGLEVKVTADRILPRGEDLRRAVRWIAEQGPCTAALIEQASCRFDLSPLDEEFLLRYFLPPDTDSPGAPQAPPSRNA
jgi:hypothetical protein